MGIKTVTLLLAAMLLQSAYSQENQMLKEGTRQIHLDFHTSGIIKNIGTDFSKEQFKVKASVRALLMETAPPSPVFMSLKTELEK